MRGRPSTSALPPSDDYKILNILGVESEVDSAALRMELCHKNPEFHEIHGIDPYSAYLAHAIVWIAAAAGGGAIGNGTYEAAKRGIKALLERQRRDENAQLSKREACDFALYAINIYQYTVLDDRPVCFEFEPISGHMTSGKWTIVCKRMVCFGSDTNSGGFAEARFDAGQPSLASTLILDERPLGLSRGNPQWRQMPNYRWRASRSDIEQYAIWAAKIHYAGSRRKYSFQVVKSIRRGDTWYVSLKSSAYATSKRKGRG